MMFSAMQQSKGLNSDRAVVTSQFLSVGKPALLMAAVSVLAVMGLALLAFVSVGGY